MNTTPLLELLSVIALKGAVVLFVALLLGLGLRRMAAARRHALWITAIATLAVLPLAMWVLPAWRVLPQTDAARDWPVMEPPLIIDNASSFLPPEDDSSGWHVSKPALPVPSQAPARPVFSWNISWQDVVDSLPMLWMIIAGLLLLRLGHSAWRLHRLEASLRPGECVLVSQTARELGLPRLPSLLIGPRDSVPMVWGVFRPRLLLPQGFETWSPEKQRGVLLHELAHLKRGDPLALWAAQWVKALHWFNPLVWLTLRQLRADQERACDDAVLRHGVRASDYAQSLLDLSRHNRLAPGLSLCALTITRCAPVEARVKAILDPTRSRESLTVRWLLALAGGALLITLPVAMLHAIESTMLRGRILDRHGVVLAESTKEKVRNYPLKTLAAHMVGYISAPDKKHVQIYGRAALEKQEDAELTAGKDVTLTLDMRMQSLAYRAMQEAGVTRGAAVVLDPRTGEILAAVSLPSYDPNLFVPVITQENWDKYISNRDIPLLNRCVKSHVPGSSFKLLIGLAGGAAGISGQKFNCTGSVTYGNKAMQCWIHSQTGGGHGLLGMSDALAVSCNCYWYQFGNAAGIEQIESMGRKIGFGSAYGITEDEDKGVLPGPDWLKEHRPQETWSEGYTANVSIGSGLVQATPLQMAVLAATVGNGGKVPQPGIVKQDTPSSWRVDLTQGTLTAAGVEPLREGMRLAVNGESGTGKPARSDKVVIAGKTGTAQVWRMDADGKKQDDDQGWFIGFAPFDKPTLAFAIVKHGAKTGGGDCGPIAKRIVEEALELPADGSGEVKPVEEKSVEAQAKNIINVVPQPLRKFNQTTAKVIGRSSSASSHSLVIDKGALDGIAADRAVIASGGVVGKTAAPEAHTTKVILLTDKLCGVSAKVEGTLEQGILAGERAAQAVPPQLRLRFLSRDAKINFGSRVYSSGEGGVFPADQLLGRVKQFISGDVSGEAIVEPAVDFSTLDEVLVMELKTGAPDQGAAITPKSKDQAQDSDILMDPQLADRWRLLKRKGFLADLPAKAVIPKPGTWMVEWASPFQFTAPREEVQLWLANSLGDAPRKHYEKRQPWPEKPGVFDYIYEGFGDCMIHIKTLDAETVEVRLWLQSRGQKPFLIAPDEAAPPTPKTAAPKELSGVVSNDALPKENAGKMKFDAEEISRQIRLLANKAGVSLRDFKMGDGRLSMIGLSKKLDEARMFGDLLTQNGGRWGIAWHVTPPQNVPERALTMFMAVGVYPTGSISAAISSPPNRSVSAVGGVVSPLSNWRTLQKFGKLADLPADYAPERIMPAESLAGPMNSMMYAFTASRKAVHAWLSASLPAKRLAAHADKLRELSETESFQHEFWSQDGCRVRVVCAEDKARVLVSRWTGILIAPDESQKPRPAGRLASDYRQEGLTSAKPAVPKLEGSVPRREPTISPEEALKRRAVSVPPVRSREIPAPTRVKPLPMSVRHLSGGLSAESEKALQRSSRMNNRMQQSLVVSSPE
jgi:beta-lactamase regulating signal transducer with metallopeptidase domain/cell shape-determining protein MreC/beta-lactamase class D